MIIVNPGGPGMSGTKLATELGPYMHAMTGDDWDIIGFDPRGIGRSDPRISCFGKPSLYRLFKTNTVLERGLDIGVNLTDPETRKRLLRDVRETDALVRSQYELCAEAQPDQLKYVGTTNVVRDIDYITTLLEGEDALM
jgi:pimeloyl-ACP methyl ester carboxylesterase